MTRAEVTETTTKILTRIDEGAALHRTLRVRELGVELADLEHLQQEITAELAALDADEA